ncbi:MFS transporter [Alcanivorax sp. 1008]|uniref:MFS transporter n=1 Tax=Alcanivorax sp. 1008 TaxID=2816853 RepID=UPI001E334494
MPKAPLKPSTFLLLLAVAVTGMGQTLVFAILPSLGRATGLADIQVGMIITCSALAFALASPVWGRFSEYLGRRPVLVIGLSGYATGTLLFALAFEAGLGGWVSGVRLLALLVTARVLQALVMAASPPAATAYIADITSAAERTRGMGKIAAAHNLGTIAGPALGGALAVFGLLMPLYAVVLITLIMALLVWHRLPESPRILEHSRPSHPFSVLDAVRASLAAYVDRRLVDVLLIGVSLFLCFAVVQQTLGFMYQDRFGLTPTQGAAGVGLAMMVAAAASLLAQVVIVQKLRWPPETLLKVAVIAIGLGSFLLLFAPVQSVAATAIAFVGLGLGLGMPGVSSAASLRVGAEEQGAVAGMMSACPALGYIIGPLLGTGIYSIWPIGPYVLVCVLVLPLAWAVWRLGRRHS